MDSNFNLDWAVGLLEEINQSPSKKQWCEQYSVYSDDTSHQKLNRDIRQLVDLTYEMFTISNYSEFLRRQNISEKVISESNELWLKEQPYECVLACITWHFRRDHFCEGSLISKSIATGALLRLFIRLKELSDTSSENASSNVN